MSSDKTRSERPPMKLSTKVLLAVMGLLIVAIVVLGILQRCGITPVNGEIILYLPLVAVFVLLGWGVYALVGRIDRRAVKILVGMVLSIILMLALMLSFSYISYMGFYALPHRYATITAPSGGHKLVIMRALDSDEARMEQRHKARLEEDPDGNPEITLEDWGYIYKAYPRVAGRFYRSSADVEGEVYLAASDVLGAGETPADAADGDTPQKTEPRRGRLMVEWLEDEAVAHFFVEDPGEAEGGDCYVRF